MTATGRTIVVAAVLAVAAFVGGYLVKPTNSATVAAVLAESLRVKAQHRADSIEAVLDLARKAADAERAKAASATRSFERANAQVAQLRARVQVLDSARVAVIDSSGVRRVFETPPAVVEQLRADSTALALADAAIKQHEAAAAAHARERSEAAQTILALRETNAALTREMAYKIDAAYTRGVRNGRIQIIALEATAVGLFLGFKFAF